MVLDYIVTVWDAAEPKTYNSKVGHKSTPKTLPDTVYGSIWCMILNFSSYMIGLNVLAICQLNSNVLITPSHGVYV